MTRHATPRSNLRQCSHCLRMRPPSRPDSILCSECDDRQNRSLDATVTRVQAMAPDEVRAAGDAVFARVQAGQRNNDSVMGKTGRWTK